MGKLHPKHRRLRFILFEQIRVERRCIVDGDALKAKPDEAIKAIQKALRELRR